MAEEKTSAGAKGPLGYLGSGATLLYGRCSVVVGGAVSGALPHAQSLLTKTRSVVANTVAYSKGLVNKTVSYSESLKANTVAFSKPLVNKTVSYSESLAANTTAFSKPLLNKSTSLYESLRTKTAFYLGRGELSTTQKDLGTAQ